MLIQSTSIHHITSEIVDYIKGETALISVAENTSVDIEMLVSGLNALGLKFMGGVFPKVIHDNSVLDKGIVINTLFGVSHIACVKNISSQNTIIPKISFEKDQDYSLLTYVDGLTSNISSFLSNLYEQYGMLTNYFGGGAGSLTLKQKPCVFNNEGLFQDAAVFAVMKMKSHIGVKHGWEKLEGPYIVTKADQNTIKEINWQNPFEIYRKTVETASKKKFNDDNFFEISKGYPLGIVRSGDEHIIRDPLVVNDAGELVCIGKVEENTLVNIMQGNKESLIIAAEMAALESTANSNRPKQAIIIDCISRILFLEDDFNKELDKIISVLRAKHPDVPVSGALTLGEISSYGNGYIEFYTKTVVVGLFE